MDAIVKRLMENRESAKPSTLAISLDPDKLQKAMEDKGYDPESVAEFLYDEYGLEDGEHYQFGNGATDILFYGEGTLRDKLAADLGESVNEEIDPTFNEDLKKYVGKPLKTLLTDLSGKVRLDIRLDKPNHYGVHGFGGMCNQVTWEYADMIIKDIAAGDNRYVDIYIKM